MLSISFLLFLKKVASKIEFLLLCYYIVYVICKNGIILNI